jgi:uncharacterized protein YchJ
MLWWRLEIIEVNTTGTVGEVEFLAFWRIPSAPGRPRVSGVLHERSHFLCEDQRWYYLSRD